ncbi:hypothetical protein, partial [Nocardiopsis sp. LOL_012]|uniref:hypothetical protein n=1 Tax=Nocardiopsis sp. LOL_012 TaxID=3345409 RepID=UPI003A8BB151
AGLHTYHVEAGDLDLLNHNCGDGVSIYRTPKDSAKDFELDNGPNVANHQGGNRMVYFGEQSVASEYLGRRGFANGMIRYDMDERFLREFSDRAFRYDWQGPKGSPRIEFEIPVDRISRFNELTRGRFWIPGAS